MTFGLKFLLMEKRLISKKLHTDMHFQLQCILVSLYGLMCFYQKDVWSQSEITVYINIITEKNK